MLLIRIELPHGTLLSPRKTYFWKAHRHFVRHTVCAWSRGPLTWRGLLTFCLSQVWQRKFTRLVCEESSLVWADIYHDNMLSRYLGLWKISRVASLSPLLCNNPGLLVYTNNNNLQTTPLISSQVSVPYHFSFVTTQHVNLCTVIAIYLFGPKYSPQDSVFKYSQSAFLP